MNRITKLKRLYKHGATKGERQAALKALHRLKAEPPPTTQDLIRTLTPQVEQLTHHLQHLTQTTTQTTQALQQLHQHLKEEKDKR